MDSSFDPPRFGGLKFTLVAGLTLLTTDALFAQSAGQSDMDAFKAKMDQMQRQYEQRIDQVQRKSEERIDQIQRQSEQRIEAMEAKMKAVEANANSGSILNTRVLTDADGTEAAGKAPAPMLDESFLKSLTRNFTFNVYMRAGVSMNGSGGAQGKTSFIMPDNYMGGGRSTSRLGNEDDFYTELTWNQAHILGDSPDLADVSFRATLNAFSSPQKPDSFSTTTAGAGVGFKEGFAEMKNVFKSAPEITFWGGLRFYDRYNIDSEDYYWLNTSGFGVGVYNIYLGPGNLYLAWIGNNADNLNEANGFSNGAGQTSLLNKFNHVGDFYKQTFDVRYKNIDIGLGKLSFVLIGNYIKGNQYELTQNNIFGDPVTGVVRTQDSYGIGGGVIWEYDFGNKSMLRISGLYGYGSTDFQANASDQINQIQGAWINQINRSLTGRSNTVKTLANGEPFVSVNPANNASTATATAYFVWNPVDCFSLGVWANWEYNDQGYQPVGVTASINASTSGRLSGSGTHINVASGSRNIVTFGVRPVYWISDNIAIQGAAAFAYEDNTRNSSGTPAFGRSGETGIFTIAPTIKPKGGFFTRPEIRLFATYAVWSNSLKGTTVTGGNPPYNGNTNQGWLIGSQMEIWF